MHTHTRTAHEGREGSGGWTPSFWHWFQVFWYWTDRSNLPIQRHITSNELHLLKKKHTLHCQTKPVLCVTCWLTQLFWRKEERKKEKINIFPSPDWCSVFGINPFTAPACKIFGLKEEDAPTSSIFFGLITHLFSNLCVLTKILSPASAKKKRRQKGWWVLNFAPLWVVFKWLYGSEGVNQPLLQD